MPCTTYRGQTLYVLCDATNEDSKLPITSGQGNPDWSRDETLIALDLLYRHGKALGPSHSDVEELSELLRSAKIHPVDKRNDKFRNSAGVALKLQNLLSATDPTRKISSSDTDKAVVADFPLGKAGELSRLAAQLRELIRDRASPEEDIGTDEDEVFREGKWLTSRHRHRDRRLRRRLLDRPGNEVLECEVCGFSPPNTERPLQESFFEAHHVTPLAEAEGQRGTRIKDMALLCAGCHRFIHKLITVNRRWIGIEEARSILRSAR